MKKIFLMVFVVVIALSSSFAQPGGGDPAARLQREIDGLTTALGLSKDDIAKITPIVTEAQKKQSETFSKMRESGSMDREKMREEMTKMRTETDKKLKEVLTAEQGLKLDEFRKKQEEERAQRMRERGQ